MECGMECLFVCPALFHTPQPKSQTEPLASRLLPWRLHSSVAMETLNAYWEGAPLIRGSDRQTDRDETTALLDAESGHSVYSQSRFCPVFREALPRFQNGWIIAACLLPYSSFSAFRQLYSYKIDQTDNKGVFIVTQFYISFL